MKDPSPAPPRILGWILERLLPSSERVFLSGDIEEIYRGLAENQGPAAARRWFRRQYLQSLPKIIVRSLEWRLSMFVNFLKVALRNLKRQKVYAFINVTGLAVGMAAVLIIFLFVRNERSYDRFHAGADRIYRLNTRLTLPDRTLVNAVVAPAVGPAILADCPEVEKATRFFKSHNPVTVRAGERSFSEKRFLFVEPGFFEVFSFPLVKGDPRTALATPGSLVLSRATAQKYFPRQDAMGKTLTINNGERDSDYIVNGIAADVPGNSHFSFDLLAPFADHEFSRVGNWFFQTGRFYVLLREGASRAALEEKFPAIVEKGAARTFGGAAAFKEWVSEGNNYELFLQPLTDIHLGSRGIDAQLETNGDRATVTLFGLVGFFVLLIALFNFVNLATARSAGRAGEIGIRKTLGSSRSLLVRQFLTESVLLSLIAFGISLAFTFLSLPGLNALIGRTMKAALLFQWPVLPALILVMILIGILAGSYPAFRLAALKPVQVLRGKLDIRRRSRLRSGLVVFQFGLSILLLITTMTIGSQLRYVQAKDLGFDKNHILALPASSALLQRYEAFRSELRRYPEFPNVALTGYIPGRPMIGEDYGPSGGSSEKRINMTLMAGDPDLADVLGLQILQGRFFNREAATDASAAVLNETASRKLGAAFGWDNPLGKTISNGRDSLTIIGIARDFHFHSLHREISPLAIVQLPQGEGPFIAVRIGSEQYPEAVSLLEKTWKAFVPQQLFEPVAFGRETEELYQAERRTGRLLSLFSLFAVGLSCLGLLGLSVFMTEQRTKEIGVRKVFGASEGRLVLMLLKKFSGWVLLANTIAWPAAFFGMRAWLQNFAYRTSLNPAVFIASGAIAFLLACLTVGGQAIRASSANPVDSLKYE